MFITLSDGEKNFKRDSSTRVRSPRAARGADRHGGPWV